MANRLAIHPGEILFTEFMEPTGLTSYRLAKELGVPLPRVYDIVKGKGAISADTALRLGAFFGVPGQFWMNLQNEFDLRTAEVARLARSGRIGRLEGARLGLSALPAFASARAG